MIEQIYHRECMTNFYPVFLNLTGRRCVVVGGGQIAEGKISKLLDSGAKTVVISPDATPGIRNFSKRGAVELRNRKYQAGDLDGAFLVIAATNDRVVNQEIFEESEKLGVLLNAVDDMPRCSFIAPSIVERGPVTIAISTGGASPALARKLRETLDDSQELSWTDATTVLSEARQMIRDKQTDVDPQRWQCCMTPEVLSLAQAGREKEAVEVLMDGLLGKDSDRKCSNITECVSGGCQIRNAEPSCGHNKMAQTAGD